MESNDRFTRQDATDANGTKQNSIRADRLTDYRSSHHKHIGSAEKNSCLSTTIVDEIMSEAGSHPGHNVSPDGPTPGAMFGETGIFSATTLMSTALPPVRWAVPGLLPEGVVLLAGRPKLGKSWLTLGLSVAVSMGGVALGSRPVERGEVLYLALEDNPRRLQKRLGLLLGNAEVPEGLNLALHWPQLDRGGAERLDDWLTEHPGARLVCVDTLKKVRPRTAGTRSVYEVDYEALEPLLPVAAEHGVAILVVHHSRKADADDPLDTISGSTGLTGGVDGAMVLKRERGRANAFLYVSGRDIENDIELALRWNADVAGWTIAGDADEYRLSEERAAILEVLQEVGEPMTPTEVADALGKDIGAVKVLMLRMFRDGQLRREGGRYWASKGNHGNPVTGT